MAKRIDEVWYAYNAKGIKIPPYKSRMTKRVNNSLIGRVWRMFKDNWSTIILTMLFVSGLLLASMYIMLMLSS